jgi:hypothetical protein
MLSYRIYLIQPPLILILILKNKKRLNRKSVTSKIFDMYFFVIRSALCMAALLWCRLRIHL